MLGNLGRLNPYCCWRIDVSSTVFRMFLQGIPILLFEEKLGWGILNLLAKALWRVLVSSWGRGLGISSRLFL